MCIFMLSADVADELQAENSSKVVVLKFYPSFQFNSRNDFLWKPQPVIKLSELKHRFKLSNRRKINVNKFELGQSARGWRMVRVLQFAVVIQAGECFGRLRNRMLRLLYDFVKLFYKKSMRVIITF